MVSPVEKNGGEVSPPGGEGAGVLQAAEDGGALAYASTASFAQGEGAAPVSQYLGLRAPASWFTQNLTPPLLSGTYSGGAFQLFSPDLARAILSSGWRCRDGAEQCAAQNPPLAAGAPPGYRNLYLAEGGAYSPLLSEVGAPALTVAPEDFQLSLVGSSPDLRHPVVSTCAALSAGAIEVPDVDAGCDPLAQNLYEWKAGALVPVNLLPGQLESTPGATLASSAGAVSADGSRIYWSGADDNLYLREDGETIQVDDTIGGGGSFEAASSDGAIAYLTKEAHLYRFDVASEEIVDLTPAGETLGVLGASQDGSYLYYLSASGLYLWHAGGTTKVATAADSSNYPAATGTARVTPDGTRLAFVSSASLTGYPNAGKAEVYLYEAPSKHLLCASCNPKGSAPKGPSIVAGAFAAGDGPAAYKPRSLADNGSRLFFNSADSLISTDSNNQPDAYEWEAKGTGDCMKAAGCIGLLSSGRLGSATFADASADGADAFFLTSVSLLPADAGSLDVYDARAGGGFPEPPDPISCIGDACQGPAPGPDDPGPATELSFGTGNPPLPKAKRKQQRKRRHHHGKNHKHKRSHR